MTGKWNVSQLAAMTAQPVRDAKVIHFLAVHDHLRSNWRGGTAAGFLFPVSPVLDPMCGCGCDCILHRSNAPPAGTRHTQPAATSSGGDSAPVSPPPPPMIQRLISSGPKTTNLPTNSSLCCVKGGRWGVRLSVTVQGVTVQVATRRQSHEHEMHHCGTTLVVIMTQVRSFFWTA